MNGQLHGFCKAALGCIVGFQVLISPQGRAASIVVTNLADSGSGSLRAAIANANNGDTISFAIVGTITNQSGELVIDKTISIQGPGPGVLGVSGNNSNRVFNIAGGATVGLADLTILSGQARNGIKGTDPSTPGAPGEHGGGIYNSGTLVVSNCFIVRCRSGAGGDGYNDPLFLSLGGSSAGGAGGDGGGIYNVGSLALIQCSVMTNVCSAGGAGGKSAVALFGSAGGVGGNGGGIYDAGTLTTVSSTFGFNSAGSGGAGGNGGNGDAANQSGGGGPGGAGGAGGAVFSLGGPTFISGTFSKNAAGTGGAGGAGGLGWTGRSFSPSNGGSGSDGGAGGAGGALMCSDGFQAVACTISENSCGAGGSGGKGGNGGNNIGGQGGNGGNGGNGGSSGGGGGGNDISTLASLQNTLVAQNSAGLGGPAGAGGTGGSGFPSGSAGFAGSPGPAEMGPDLFGSYVSSGHNLIGRDDGNTGFVNGVTNDLVGSGSPLNPAIAPLANNGSWQPTCALLAGSPAIDAGDDTLMVAPHHLVTDQRGVPRLIGSHVDIGAYELRPAVEPIFLTAKKTNGVFLITLTNLPGASLTVVASTNPSMALSDWNVLGPATEPVAGQFQFTDSSNLSSRVYRVRSP